MVTLPPEKLGSFYLGAKYDIEKSEIIKEQVNYDSRDLTTHAVCVGMTGSGKTGLCIGLLEEAALDKVPAIIIDPKGDMTNLLLQFENLDPESFKKWINPDDASRKDMSVDDYAAATAKKWKKGIGSWGQDTSRIKALKNAVDYTIFTPGSDAGVPINIMGSFAAPKVDFDSEAEMLRDRIQGTVAALLGMVDCKEDPVRGREGILLANLFEHYWRIGEGLDLASIIRGIQKPPFKQLGVFDVDTFFPSKDRFQLAMDFNSLMASPQFSSWLKGEYLDIEKIYFTPEGKPRHSIFYIAHLSDSERMFFVTLLLNSLITWMRRQSGTTSLRSLVYFDEIFGYFPPTAAPPSKKPLLTILKQARAYGVGAVLVTQNPVDIDYKGLSNAGTWFIGKLQTERDKMRVLDGLQGAIAASGNSSDSDFSRIISSLSSRVFLYHNVHESAPVIYHTRWALSYLRGPMTRPQVKDLMAAKKELFKNRPLQQGSLSVAEKMNIQTSDESVSDKPAPQKQAPPSVSHEVEQRFLPVWRSAEEVGFSKYATLYYEPMVLGEGKVRFYDAKRGIDKVKPISYLAEPPDEFGRVDWSAAISGITFLKNLIPDPDHPDTVNTRYGDIPQHMNSGKDVTKVKKAMADWLYAEERYITLEHPKLKLFKDEDESEESFKMNVQQAARELRDEELDEMQDKFDVKFKKLQDRIRREEQDLDEAEADLRHRKQSEALNVVETVFSVFVKRRSRSLSSVATKRRMKRKAKEKVEAAEEDLQSLEIDYKDLENELNEKLDKIREKWETVATGIKRKEIKPRKTDIKIDNLLLIWHPIWISDSGKRASARK